MTSIRESMVRWGWQISLVASLIISQGCREDAEAHKKGAERKRNVFDATAGTGTVTTPEKPDPGTNDKSADAVPATPMLSSQPNRWEIAFDMTHGRLEGELFIRYDRTISPTSPDFFNPGVQSDKLHVVPLNSGVQREVITIKTRESIVLNDIVAIISLPGLEIASSFCSSDGVVPPVPQMSPGFPYMPLALCSRANPEITVQRFVISLEAFLDN